MPQCSGVSPDSRGAVTRYLPAGLRALRRTDPYTLLILTSVIAVLVLYLAGCFNNKMSAAKTARLLHASTASRRVTCVPGRGDLSSWDYQCKVIWRVGLGPPEVLGVDVNSHEITDQAAP